MFIHAHDVDAVGITVDDAEYGDGRPQDVDEIQEFESCEVGVPFALNIGKRSDPFTFATCHGPPRTVTMIPWPWTQFFQYWEAAKVRNVAYEQVNTAVISDGLEDCRATCLLLHDQDPLRVGEVYLANGPSRRNEINVVIF